MSLIGGISRLAADCVRGTTRNASFSAATRNSSPDCALYVPAYDLTGMDPVSLNHGGRVYSFPKTMRSIAASRPGTTRTSLRGKPLYELFVKKIIVVSSSTYL